MCGYTTTVVGAMSWNRTTGNVTSQASGPQVDRNNSPNGNLKCCQHLFSKIYFIRTDTETLTCDLHEF